MKFDETCVIVRVGDLNNLEPSPSITKWDGCFINSLMYDIHIFKDPIRVSVTGYNESMRIKSIIKPNLAYHLPCENYNLPRFETLFGKRFSEIDGDKQFLIFEVNPKLTFQKEYA